MTSKPAAKPWYRILYVQVLIGALAGILIGYLWPQTGKALQPLGDGFIKLIKMIIAPIIFCTVAHGVAAMHDVKKLGRVGVKTMFYFEVVSGFALVIGLVVANVLQPGAGFNIDPQTLDPKIAETYAARAQTLTFTSFILNIIPGSFFEALARGDILQVVFVSLLTGFAISSLGPKGVPILHVIDQAGKIFFAIMGIVVKAAPIGAFGAMAFTVGSYGIKSLQPLMYLMFAFYLTAALFVVVALGLITRAAGFSIFRFIRYIKEELFLVLGTSSSETALPGMMHKLKRLGCAESTVGLVLPTGYSFNLDGTNIYMTMAAIFLAQATNTPLSLGEQLTFLLVATITSNGAAGVTGSGFVTLAATLAVLPTIPIQSLAILLGIDRFMSECRSLTNLIGNGVATAVISRWEGELTAEELNANLNRETTITEVLGKIPKPNQDADA